MPLRFLLALLALTFGGTSSPLSAQQPAAPPQTPATAALSGVRYALAVDSAGGAARTIRVSMSFQPGGTAPISLSMSRWTPGAYELSEFARYVRRFRATGDGGAELPWSRPDPHSWLIVPAGDGRVTVSYEVAADTLDTAMAWARPDLAMVNGTAVFMYPTGGSLGFSSSVAIHAPASWRVATGMRSTSAREYAAADYHELVDMPFLIGRFDLDSTRIVDRWFRLATYPEGSVTGSVRAQMWEQLRRMVPPIVQVWREIPFDSYTILQVAHESVGGASGLEHANSHLNVVSPFAIGHPFIPSLMAHEIVHAWNVKRLRPAELWPYRYDREQWTPLLWVSEGVTDYYADLALVRGGIITRAGFLRNTADKAQEVMNAPQSALEDASVATWVRPVDGSALLYYAQGSLAALLLDILIRDATANRVSLDSVMLDLYRRTFREGRGFTSQDWWESVARAAGAGAGDRFEEFRRRHVAGREPLPFARVLPLAALRLSVDTVREPVVGVRTVLDADGVLVTGVEPGGAAEEAGVQPGDYLLSVGGLRVTDRDFADRFRLGWANRQGTPLVLRVRRAGRDVDLTGTVRLSTRYAARIEEDRAAPQAAVRVREGILRGLTSP
jgi:predicted metalloprotease with PDZ domain